METGWGRPFWIPLLGVLEFCFFLVYRSKKIPIILVMGICWIRSLAVSYSRMGRCHTTIGAGAFHVRVRDGNGWDHTAMAAKENGWVVIAFYCLSRIDDGGDSNPKWVDKSFQFSIIRPMALPCCALVDVRLVRPPRHAQRRLIVRLIQNWNVK
jgi:hypothetical protein